jgi:hypothetical protein
MRAAAALASLLLNALLLAPLLHRSAGAPVREERLQAVWITRIEPAATETAPAIARPEISAQQFPVHLDMPQFDIQEEQAADDGGGGNGAPSYVRYVGAVTARIQRAWSVPRVAGEQHCRLRIAVGAAGEVQGVTPQLCDADPLLQASIADAIRRAAPLPTEIAGDQRSGDLLLDFAVSAADANGLRSSVRPANAAL